MLIPALQKDEQLLQDIDRARRQTDRFYLWWLGQSGYLIQWQNRHLLIDPYLSDSLTKKYADTDKPHIRMTEKVIDPGRLDFIDVVTSSHNHTDHLDGETLIPLIAANPGMKLLIPEANRAFVADRIQQPLDFPVGLNDGKQVALAGFTFYGIPAAHNQLERDELGRCKFMGYVIHFGPWTIYHSGDTLWHPDVLEALLSFEIDLALLPINGNKPERRVAGNLNAEEAVRLAQLIGAKMLIPCHYHMFTFNTADPLEFIAIAEREGQPNRVLRCGERWSSKEMSG